MYDAPFPSGVVVGWVLAAVVAVLLLARAVRTERRVTRPGPRPTAVRVLDGGLDVALGFAVLVLLITLTVIVVSAYNGWFMP